MVGMLYKHSFILNLVIIPVTSSSDYWSDEFDPKKDCAQMEKIKKARDQVRLLSWKHYWQFQYYLNIREGVKNL